MATYFVFGNAPGIKDLMGFSVKDEISDDIIRIEDAENRSGHYIINLNGHMVGAQLNNSEIITAIYGLDGDNEGVRLLILLLEKWSEENSIDEKDIATTISDDEMSIYLQYV
jgi:hypothetical protein